MGQGAEDSGGYEVEYEPYAEGLCQGSWTQKNGREIKVSDMSERHIKNTIPICERARDTATFSCDADMWQEWIDVFRNELAHRKSAPASEKRVGRAILKEPPRGRMVKMVCTCGVEYDARSADLKRGWALSCSKRCAAIRKTYGRPPARRKQ